jgi:hypothetical protein
MDAFLALMRIRKRDYGIIMNLLEKRNIFKGGFGVSSNGRLMRPFNAIYSHVYARIFVESPIQRVKV